jgi:hypothetical protein
MDPDTEKKNIGSGTETLKKTPAKYTLLYLLQYRYRTYFELFFKVQINSQLSALSSRRITTYVAVTLPNST